MSLVLLAAEVAFRLLNGLQFYHRQSACTRPSLVMFQQSTFSNCQLSLPRNRCRNGHVLLGATCGCAPFPFGSATVPSSPRLEKHSVDLQTRSKRKPPTALTARSLLLHWSSSLIHSWPVLCLFYISFGFLALSTLRHPFFPSSGPDSALDQAQDACFPQGIESVYHFI